MAAPRADVNLRADPRPPARFAHRLQLLWLVLGTLLGYAISQWANAPAAPAPAPITVLRKAPAFTALPTPVVASATRTVHIAMSLCSIVTADGKPAGPGLVALKSILLSDAQHGDWRAGPGRTALRLEFYLVVDSVTQQAWDSGHAVFAEIRALVEWHPQRYVLHFVNADSLATGVAEAIAEEAAANPGAAGGAGAAGTVNINMFAKCSGARLYLPLVLRHLPRVIYLDYDTVTLCDIVRLDDEFDRFAPGAALGMVLEDPTGGRWADGWYTRHNLPVVQGGANAGVFLFDVQRLRNATGSLTAYWTTVVRVASQGSFLALVGERYKRVADLGDQDVLNVMLYQQPSLLHVIPHRWSIMAPAVRIRITVPDYVPEPPCLVHYNGQGYNHGFEPERVGNGAFIFIRDWQMI
jgi:lipopolysaccharide biosynthesis glycosyltransferase